MAHGEGQSQARTRLVDLTRCRTRSWGLASIPMWHSGVYGYLSDYIAACALTILILGHVGWFFYAWPQTYRPRLRLLLGNFLIGCAGLGCVSLTAETYLRFVSVRTDVLGATMTCKRWRLAYAQLNSLYCRDKEWALPKPKGVHRIAFVGDSFTFGWGIDDPADRFTDRLQAKFDSRSPSSIEVMNVAWAGWNSRDQLDFISNRLLAYELNELVLCYLPNDLEHLVPQPKDIDLRIAPKSWAINTEASFLLDWFYYRIVVPRMMSRTNYLAWLAAGYRDPEILRQQEATMADLARTCRKRGIRLRAVIFPFLAGDMSGYDAEYVHRVVTGLFQSQGIPVIDLLPAAALKSEDNLILGHYDPHPNEAAHALFADEIWRAYYEQ